MLKISTGDVSFAWPFVESVTRPLPRRSRGSIAAAESGHGSGQIGRHSTIGKDTWIEGSPPHRFHVSVTMPNPDQQTLQRQYQIASALIDLQKPAHTTYDLEIVFTTMQIGVRSTIGRDTLLGSAVVAP